MLLLKAPACAPVWVYKMLLAIALALPWLMPFAPGPSPAVLPWLFSAVTLSFVLLFLSWMPYPVCREGCHTEQSHSLVASVAVSWMLAGLISSVIGLLQYYGGADVFSPWVSRAAAGEAYANLRQRNQFASLTNIALAALVWSGGTCLSEGLRRALLPLGACLLAAANAASSSRTGAVQILLLCVLYGLWGDFRQADTRRILVAAVLGYAVATVLLPWTAGLDPSLHGLMARLRSEGDGCDSRITLWSNVLHLITLKPWTGWGPGELDYAHYMTLYGGPRFCQLLDNAHNLPLHLAVECGVPVAVLLCGGFLVWILRRRPWKETDARRKLAWAVLSVILLHSMLEYPLWYGPFQLATLFCFHVLWRTPKSLIRLQSAQQPPVLRRLLLALFSLSLMVTTGYAMVDYRRVSQIYMAPAERDSDYRENTLEKVRSSWLFKEQVKFAELSITPLVPANAAWTYGAAMQLLHYSPEPKVIEKVIESAAMLGRDHEALAHLARYRAAFPEDYARWAALNRRVLCPVLNPEPDCSGIHKTP